MPTNAIFSYGNLVDRSDCVLSCSVTPTLSLDYMKTSIRNRVARIPASPAFQIKGTHGVAVSASMAALVRTNLTAAATARFQGYSDANWTTLIAATDVTANPAVRTASLGQLTTAMQKVVVFFPASSIRSWKWTITDTANPSPIDISRAHVSSTIEFGTNVAYGLKWKLNEESQLWTTDAGGVRADVLGQYRTMTLPLDYFSEAERALLTSFLQEMGIGRSDFIASIFPTGTAVQLRDYEMDVIVQSGPDLNLAASNYNNTSLVLRET